MSEVIGTLHLSLDCFCRPPKRLTTNAEKQSDRCDECGMEILSGVLATQPRLRLVEDEPEAPNA